MIYEMLEATLDHLDEPAAAGINLVKFELAMLGELGFGLDLSTCVATGVSDELIYVSPKSGGAISRGAGEAWRDRLLRLPQFLRDDDTMTVSAQDLQDGFAITGLFLQRHVLEARGLTHSDARAGFIAAVTRSSANRPA